MTSYALVARPATVATGPMVSLVMPHDGRMVSCLIGQIIITWASCRMHHLVMIWTFDKPKRYIEQTILMYVEGYCDAEHRGVHGMCTLRGLWGHT